LPESLLERKMKSAVSPDNISEAFGGLMQKVASTPGAGIHPLCGTECSKQESLFTTLSERKNQSRGLFSLNLVQLLEASHESFD
jgi:hypothetical protein